MHTKLHAGKGKVWATVEDRNHAVLYTTECYDYEFDAEREASEFIRARRQELAQAS